MADRGMRITASPSSIEVRIDLAIVSAHHDFGQRWVNRKDPATIGRIGGGAS